jgi:hypothetical protein
MSDPMELLRGARALRGAAENSRTSLSQDDRRTLAPYAGVLNRDAERLEGEASSLVERQPRTSRPR